LGVKVIELSSEDEVSALEVLDETSVVEVSSPELVELNESLAVDEVTNELVSFSESGSSLQANSAAQNRPMNRAKCA
jgi:hypothetical protein